MIQLIRERTSKIVSFFMHREIGCIKCLSTFVTVAFCFFGCATQSIQQQKQAQIQITISKEAYDRIEPKLLAMKSGVMVDSSGLEWKKFGFFQGQKLTDLIIVSDGWIGDLSGGSVGGMYNFGSLYGRSGNIVFGEHVFGYLSKEALVVPKYLLRTRADMISEKEFNSLEEKNTSSIGWCWTSEREKSKTYFKNVTVHEVVALEFADENEQQLHYKKIKSVSDFAQQYYTRNNFDVAQEKLAILEKGTDIYEVIKSLGSHYFAGYSGENVVLYMPGFLNYKGEYRWSKMTLDGLFVIWPFGYVEGKKEIPKLALITKNGKLFKVVPYESKDALEKQLDE